MSEANELEILSAREDKIRIPKRPCNVLFIIQILMKCLDLKQLVLFIFEMMKKWSPTSMLCNMKQDMKVMKICDKNVNVVEKKYIEPQKYLIMKTKLAFYWLIVFFTMMTPIFSHVKDKNDMFTARGEDMIF